MIKRIALMLFSALFCLGGLTPAASRARLIAHVREFFPNADQKELEKLI